MKTTEYYVKPYKVRAARLTPDKSNIEAVCGLLREDPDCLSYKINEQADLGEIARDSLGPVDESVYIDVVSNEGVHHYTINEGDWLVENDGGYFLVTHEDFVGLCFPIITEVKRHLPTLEELIDED